MRYVVIDSETTGLDCVNDRIVELAAVEIVDGIIGKTYQTYVNSGIPSSRRAFEVHGITQDVLDSAPTMLEIYPQFIGFVGDSPVVGHSLSFDLGFLCEEFLRIGEFAYNRWNESNSFCTRKLSKTKWPSESSALRNVAPRLGIDFDNEQAHGALYDATITAKVFIELAPQAGIIL